MELNIDIVRVREIINNIIDANIYTIIDDILVITYLNDHDYVLYLYTEYFIIQIKRNGCQIFDHDVEHNMTGDEIIYYAKKGLDIMEEQFNVTVCANNAECKRILWQHLEK